MQQDISTIIEELTSVIDREIPNDKSDMMEFISDLEIRFPQFPRAIRSIFEMVYQKTFNEKFVW
jgi:hypothetical protein